MKRTIIAAAIASMFASQSALASHEEVNSSSGEFSVQLNTRASQQGRGITSVFTDNVSRLTVSAPGKEDEIRAYSATGGTVFGVRNGGGDFRTQVRTEGSIDNFQFGPFQFNLNRAAVRAELSASSFNDGFVTSSGSGDVTTISTRR